ncbi:MAG: crossover junction endodeoxyribonuclease RuvC [Thermosulfidibacteraceae bacterium]|jgi:crossover junction endodeoxyribonuclease RuvC
MVVMAIDPGYIKTGIAVCRYLDVLFLDTIHLKGEKLDRVGLVVNVVKSVVERYKPQVTVMERAFYGRNVDSAFKLSEVRGAIIGVVSLFGIDYKEYHPSEIKRMLTGNGRASKDQIMWMVRRLFGYDSINSEHEADALALVYTYFVAEGIL